MWSVLRVYSFIFESILCLMGLVLAVFALANHQLDVQVAWLPWRGADAPVWIASVAVLGLICVVLAVSGTLRVLLFLYSGAIVYILVRGLFLDSQYTFSGPEDAQNAAILIFGALLAFAGAWPLSSKRRRRGRD